MNKIFRFFLFNLALVGSFAVVNAREQQTHAAAKVTGKAWEHGNKKLFDIFLRSNPVTLFRIQKSSKTIQETASHLADTTKLNLASEAEFVKAQLNKSLELVQPFIDDIRGYKDLIEPLLSESLKNHKFEHKILLSFFDSPTKESLDAFTTREVKTVQQLRNLLLEIQGFFADLFVSLSKETKDAYKAFLAKNSAR